MAERRSKSRSKEEALRDAPDTYVYLQVSTPTPYPGLNTTPSPTSTPTPTNTPVPTPTPSSTPTPTPVSADSQNYPNITSMSYADSNFGQYIHYTIEGSNFGSTQGTIKVFENGNSVNNVFNITGWQETAIQTSIVGPAGSQYSLEITNSNGKVSNRFSFTQPLGQPYFGTDTMSPTGAKPGETLTISGDRFDSGNGKVTFDGIEGSIVSWSNTEIKVVIPGSLPAGKDVEVVVISSKGQHSSMHYFTLGD